MSIHKLKKGITRGYWILKSREKFCHIPKSREILSIFPIPNFSPRHPVEHFVLDWKPSLNQWQLISSLKKLYHDIIGAYQGVLDLISVKNLSRIIGPDIKRTFHISPVYRIEKLCHGCSSSSFSQFQNLLSQYPPKKVANCASRKRPAGLKRTGFNTTTNMRTRSSAFTEFTVWCCVIYI